VAGIGASAGGLDAFKKLLAAMPPISGIALVLVPHLDPAHESLMVELLARHTAMPVIEVMDDMPVEANRVYIIPPNKYMTIHGGVLRLTGPVERRAAQTSIDLFLRSLADDQRERSICIILSGTGSHGTLGLKAIKAAGGMAMVQDPATAEFPLMPQSAIATGLADYILPVEQMPEALIKYIQHGYVNGGKPGAAAAEAPDQLDQVLALVRARTRLDFRSYRKKMLARRIERRMSLSHFDQSADYQAFLREHPDEVQHLAKDLLISVTSFFRDPEGWRALETQVIAPLVRAKEPDAPLRLWSVGCATGEEPYSLGMLLLEQLAVAQKHCPVQIFATDVDEDALEVARQAVYPESIAADVSPARLSRFFTRVSDSSYQVSKQLRETVTFARQNLLTDAPFSKLDLVVCRNLLIYLEPEVQKRVIELLHFALNEGGTLFLGSSETIGRNIDLFEPISAKRRIYRRIGPTRANNLQFPVMQLEPRQARAQPANRPQPPPKLAELAQDFLLRRYALACVVINRNYEVLHFAGPTQDYLLQPSGPPTHDLLALARAGLETKLRVIIQRAIRENTAQSVKDVMMRHTGVTRRVNIEVEPLNLSKQTEGLLLISFQEQPNPVGETLAEAKDRMQTADTEMVRQLEQELETTRDDLQSTIEELESSNEELKASNEEVMSMNEELQSANEELETSKEELQSLNEELTTVNNQLHEKVQELETANNDMANLFSCTEIATLFLDPGLRIKRFTPATTRLFNLIATDVGRPIGDIVKKFTDDDLLRDAEQLLGNLIPREKEVRTEDGRWFARRIVPYRTLDNRIDGVVITFVDVTERKQAADAVVHRLAAIVESSADAIFSKDLDGTIRTWNAGAERLYGYTAEEVIGRSIRLTIPDDRVEEWTNAMTRLAHGDHVELMETERVRKDGRRVLVAMTYSPLRDDSGKIVGASATARDITERKHAEEALFLQGQVAANLAEGVGLVTAEDGLLVYANERYEKLFGYGPGELLGRHVSVLNAGEGLERDETAERIIRALREKGVWTGQVHNVKKDGTQFWTHANISAFEHPKYGTVWVGALTDITERKAAESALQASEERLRAILNTASDAIITIDHHGIIQSVNRGAEQMFGYAAAEMLGQNVRMLMASPHHEAHDGYIARYLRTGKKHIIGINREIEARRKDGTVFPADLAVSEIEHLKLFTGIHRDLTERKRLERDVVEAASLEQRRIGQDLHDTVAQELTALNLLAGDLGEALRTDSASGAQLVERMVQGLHRSQQELRAILRGLLPVAVDTQGLMAALADLANRTQQEGNVTCTFACPEPVTVADNLTATHFYLIAQEAVRNAVKHARPRNVSITLESDHTLALRVQDDGIGMPAQLTEVPGLGLRIMRNRAAIIGAALTIEPVEPTGTLVTCTLARNYDERKKVKETSPGPDRR
jgi:two-component system CheB/CheR fusion protein